ncbi:hypothetical protein EVAR_26483_1 [Eumeta japonica]|uniref:Uncharacterized protein n=1 Tax=Eumeta variegata TaxID=151549 RepID=A0A4C1VAE8_EUMVA|nr:hypothetical protein EVAR_26483_1 [Eumeta japonica]
MVSLLKELVVHVLEGRRHLFGSGRGRGGRERVASGHVTSRSSSTTAIDRALTDLTYAGARQAAVTALTGDHTYTDGIFQRRREVINHSGHCSEPASVSRHPVS